MATEKINEIFDIEAINKQVQAVKAGIESTLSDMEKFAKKASDLNKTIEQSGSFKEVADATDKVRKAQEEYAKQVDKLNALKKQETQLNERLAKTQQDMLAKIAELQKRIDEETNALNNRTKAMKDDMAQSQANINQKKNESKAAIDNSNAIKAEADAYREAVDRINDYIGSRSENINLLLQEQTVLANLKSEIDKLNKIEKQNGKLTQEQKNQRIALVSAQQESKQAISELSSAIKNDVKMNQAAKGSMDEMEQAVGRMKKVYRSLGDDIRNSPFGQELLAQINATDEKLNELNASIGNHHKTIGDYEGAIKRVIASQTPFIGQLIDIAGNSKGVAGGFSAMIGGAKAFGKALLGLLANPVVAILAAIALAIGVVVKAMKSSEEATARWNAVLAPLTRAFNFFLSIVQKGVGFILSLVEVQMKLLGSLAKLAEKLPFVGKYIKEVNDANREAIEIEKAKYELTKRTRKFNEESAEAELKVSDLRNKAAQKDKYTTEERIALLDEAIAIETKVAEERKAIAEENLRILETEANWADNDAATNDKLSEAKIAVTRATIELNTKTRELNAQRTEAINKMKEEKKAEDELVKSRKAAQVSLMKEGIDKQLAQINANYDGQITSLKTKLREETTLSKKAQEEINRTIILLEQNREKDIKKAREDFNKEVLKMNTDAQRQLEDVVTSLMKEGQEKQIEILNNSYDRQVEDLKLRLAQEKNLTEEARKSINNTIVALEQKRQQDIEKINSSFSVKRIKDESLMIRQQAYMAESEELKALADRYNSTNMTKEQFEQEKLEISRKYNKLAFEGDISTLEDIVKNSGLQGEELKNIEKELAQKRVEYNQWANQQIIDNDTKAAEKRKELEKELQNQRIQLIGEALSTVASVTNSMFERRVQQLDSEIEKIEERKNADIEAIEQMGLSDEEAEARKMAIEARAAAQTDRLEKQKKKMQKQQAIAEKAYQLMQVAMETAKAVANIKLIMATLAANPVTLPFVPMAAAQIPIAIATGALQAAVIAAQPIPKYAKGTEDHPGGLAIVGDGGQKEVAILPDGGYYVTPSIPTLVDLPKGTEVLPSVNEALMSITKAPRLDTSMPTSTDRIEKRIESLEGAMKDMVKAIEKNRSQISVTLDQNGTWKVYDQKKGLDEYLNKNLRIQR